MRNMAGAGAHGVGIWGRPAHPPRGGGSSSDVARVHHAHATTRHFDSGVQGQLQNASSTEPLNKRSGRSAPSVQYATSPDEAVGLAMLGTPVTMDEKLDHHGYERSLSDSSRSSVALSCTVGSVSGGGRARSSEALTRQALASPLPYDRPADGDPNHRISQYGPGDPAYFSIPVRSSSAVAGQTTDGAVASNPFATPSERMMTTIESAARSPAYFHAAPLPGHSGVYHNQFPNASRPHTAVHRAASPANAIMQHSVTRSADPRVARQTPAGRSAQNDNVQLIGVGGRNSVGTSCVSHLQPVQRDNAVRPNAVNVNTASTRQATDADDMDVQMW